MLTCGSVVLAIFGLAGVLRDDLAAITVIGLGVLLIFAGANVVLRYIELLYEAGATTDAHSTEVSRGITAEFVAGIAGVMLGILALLQIVPMTLMSSGRNYLRGNASVNQERVRLADVYRQRE